MKNDMKTETKVKRKGLSTTDLAYIAICSVLIIICSWISIPTAVPFTMQTFAVFCSLNLLGGKKGTIAVIVYLLIGAIGVPVFSGFKSGYAILIGPTGGYMLGFIFMGLIFIAGEILGKGKLKIRIAAMVIGLIVCYAFGTAWFMVVYTNNTGAIGLGTALTWCVIPFIVPDICKMILAIFLSEKLRKELRRGGLM